MAHEDTTLTSTLGLITSAIDHYGVDSGQIVTDAGIDTDSVTDPSGR